MCGNCCEFKKMWRLFGEKNVMTKYQAMLRLFHILHW